MSVVFTDVGADLTWKKRYFTLVGTHLRQYSRREEAKSGEEPTQWISILNCNLGLWPVADRYLPFLPKEHS